MLQYFANTEKEPTSIVVGVEVKKPMRVHIRAIDPYKRGAVYYERWNTIGKDGEDLKKEFEIRLPQSPKKLLIQIFQKEYENDDVLRLYKLEKKTLPQHIPCLSGKKVSSFLKFAKEFSENAGILAEGRYKSDDKKYVIDYLPVIVHEGQELTTPARISNSTGRMEISAKYFRGMTIPMRMAILCHEFSHFYLNEEQRDEIEADLNALTLYLGMGYSEIEGHKAFIETFKKTPTETNQERYKYIKTFMDNFDKLKYEICFPN